MSETWLTENQNNVTAVIKSYGYNIIHKPRSDDAKTRGGGVAIVFKKSLNLTPVFSKKTEAFESVSAKFRDDSGENVCCSCVYRTGNINELFFGEFDDFLGSLFIKYSKFIICGDINIHLDKKSDSNSQKFNDLISSYGLNQLVDEPTHKSGHTLDIVIGSHNVIKESTIEVSKADSASFPTCDHFTVCFYLNQCDSIQSNQKKTITFRNIDAIDTNVLRSDLSTKLTTLTISKTTFSTLMKSYDSVCLQILDSHAPLLVKDIVDRRSAPWFDGEYKSLRAIRRQAERVWKAACPATSQQKHEIYINIRDKCSELANKKKHEYFRSQFQRHKYSPKSLYKFVDNILDKEKTLALPPTDNLKECVDSFNRFFEEKIDTIRENFKCSQESANGSTNSNQYSGSKLKDFKPVNISEIDDILSNIEFKSSTVDPIPAKLIKENKDIFLPVLCDIVNASLTSGTMDGTKLAHITPLLKGTGLDTTNLKNYRPISNLSFIGKLIERVVLIRLNEHLDLNNLNITHQSGYKKGHSTETLLVKIVNDLLIATNENKATVVMLLDLSAAFDTVDHDKLLQILRKELGIEGNAWKWFKSFLSGRCQRVKIADSESYVVFIKFGVPQGSVLGPVLFNLYIRSLYSTVLNQRFAVQGFADDHQVYNSFSSLDQYTMLINEVPECFIQICKWMDEHYLLLNPAKTEIIVFGSPSILNELTIRGTFLREDICIRFSPVVKNLGFRLDENLSFKKQISHVKSSCFLKLRSLARIRSFLSTKQMTILVQAVVISFLDYCNALYFGSGKSNYNQLQVIQNRACRIIFGLKKRDDVVEHMKSLHWLRINERVLFKVLLLIYKCVHGLAPTYLNDLISFNNISLTRRNSLHISLCQASHPRAFQTAAPKLWSQLPDTIKSCASISSFKSSLKTFLFKKSYNID